MQAAVERIRRAGVRVEGDGAGRTDVAASSTWWRRVRCSPAAAAEVRPLAALVHDKTAGNPFFVIQFFQELSEGAC